MVTEPQDSVLERFVADDIGGTPALLRRYISLLDLFQSSGNMVDYGSNVHSTLILPDRVEIEFDYGGRSVLSHADFRDCLLATLRFVEANPRERHHRG